MAGFTNGRVFGHYILENNKAGLSSCDYYDVTLGSSAVSSEGNPETPESVSDLRPVVFRPCFSTGLALFN